VAAAPLLSIQIQWQAKRSRAACNLLRQALQSPWPRPYVAEATLFPSSSFACCDTCDVGAQHTHRLHRLLDQRADKYHAGAQHESCSPAQFPGLGRNGGKLKKTLGMRVTAILSTI